MVLSLDITREKFDAVLFDLDGVLTSTAKLHAIAWKQTFDSYLKDRADKQKETFVPFEIGKDYLQYVDGKPRYDGVRSFLASRGIELAYGTPNDPPTLETVCGIGNKKNDLVNHIMATQGVEAYPGSVKALNHLREHGFKTAVVSSSNNCEAVLKAAGIESYFNAYVDGRTATALNLAGKPAPDTFLEAARQLGTETQRSIVVEDAVAGVEAGKRGGFGLVIGVARSGNADALKEHGADLVVNDLSELLPRVVGRRSDVA